MRFVLLCSLAAVLALSGCSASKSAGKAAKKSSQFFPEAVSNIEFNMPMDEVLKIRGLKTSDAVDNNFRMELIEKMNTDGIEFIGYYFDNEGDKPLYELIIGYESEAKRDQVATELFGAPNHESNTEYMKETKMGYRIHSWKYKKKLIVVGKIAGTEWEEGQ